LLLHASCVAVASAGVLIRGRSGSGKSSLALELMALGALLVSDDRTEIKLRDAWPVASAPKNLQGLIEARGIGILSAANIASARIVLVVDLDRAETDRLPPDRTTELLGHSVALLHKVESMKFSAGILQYLKGGKVDI